MTAKLRKIITSLIILTMIVSSTGLAFAGEADGGKTKLDPVSKGSAATQMADTTVPDEFLDGFENNNAGDGLTAKTASVSKPITVTSIKNGTTAEFEAAGANYSDIYYNATADAFYDDPNFCGYSQQVTLQKGTLMMIALVAGDGIEYAAGATYGLFTDASLNNPVGSSYISQNDEEAGTIAISVPQDGTYYIGAYSGVTDEDKAEGYDVENYQVRIAAMHMSGKDRTVYSGTRIAVGQVNPQTNTFTFKATKTGYIKISTTDVLTKFRLYNASNVARSKQSVSCSSIVYGVKKGTTYKIKVTAPSNEVGGYTMLLTNYAVTESSGATKAKAKTIYRGSSKAKKGSIIAGYNTADWYKFTLTGSKAVNIKMTGATNETIKISVYKGSKLIKTYPYNRTNSSLLIKSVGKWTKGTYYIKVYRANSTSSGHYKVYWYYR